MGLKYKNKKIIIDNITFDSKLEGKHYNQLKLLEQAGEIKDLELQPRYDLIINDVKIGFYKADFRFFDIKEDRERVIDSKGMDTPVSKLKRKMVKAVYGVDVELWK
jgi:hypothetical protein